MADEGQWSLKVKIVSLDTEAIDKKSKWVQGDTLTLQIEGHGTVGMAKQRIALLVGAHEKDLVEEMNFPEGTKLNDITKLEDIPNFGNGSTLFVHVKMPTVVLSDDEGLRAEEEPEPPAMASPEVRSKELTEEEQDKQGALKQETAMQMAMAVLEANHAEVMAVMRQTRDWVQRLEARLGAGRVPGPAPQAASSAASSSAAAGSSALVTASSVSPVPPLGSATALPSARLARLLGGKVSSDLEKEGVDARQLREASGKLEPPLTAERAAQAYDKAREVRKICPPKLEEVGKNAALVVREVLVLCICCSAGCLSDAGFESALEQAFGGRRRPLSPELRSQLHLARSAICRIGRDRVLFDRRAPKIWCPR